MRSFFNVLIIVAAVIVGRSTGVHAQSSAFKCLAKGELSNQRAREALAKVQERYVEIEALHGSFRQDSYVAALDQSETSSGEMWFGRPGKMRWVYQKPRPQIVVINSKTLWLYQPDNNQVVIDDIGNVLLSSLPLAFMMGLGDLNKDFEIRGGCTTESNGMVLNLAPKRGAGGTENQEALEGFDLLIDATRFLPKGAHISSLGGNLTTIVFSDLSTTPQAEQPGRFVLEYPKGVDVMDRRLSH